MYAGRTKNMRRHYVERAEKTLIIGSASGDWTSLTAPLGPSDFADNALVCAAQYFTKAELAE